MKDPLAVQDWLRDCIPPDLGESNNGKEIRPLTVYGEGLAQAEQRLQQTCVGRNLLSEPDYVPLHPGVIENGKLGLF